MQKSLMTVALRATMAGMAFLALGAAQAQTATTTVNNGQISFQGSINTSTCTLKGDSSRTVPMNSVKPGDFKSINTTAGATPFTIVLKDCTIPVAGDDATKDLPTKASIQFSGPNVNASNRLDNQGEAKGVDIVINSVGSLTAGNALETPSQIALAAGENALNFTAAYYSTQAKVTSGSVVSSVNFVITYQ